MDFAKLLFCIQFYSICDCESIKCPFEKKRMKNYRLENLDYPWDQFTPLNHSWYRVPKTFIISACDTTSLVYVKACVHVCAEARGQCGLSSSIALHRILIQELID